MFVCPLLIPISCVTMVIIIILLTAELCDWLEPREQYLLTLGLSGSVEVSEKREEKREREGWSILLKSMMQLLSYVTLYNFFIRKMNRSHLISSCSMLQDIKLTRFEWYTKFFR